MPNAKDKYYRKGMKGGGGKSQLPKDPEGHQTPGFLGRGSVKRSQGRTGYTEETRLGQGGKGRKISLPMHGGKSKY